jgi:hypothetical protein
MPRRLPEYPPQTGHLRQTKFSSLVFIVNSEPEAILKLENQPGMDYLKLIPSEKMDEKGCSLPHLTAHLDFSTMRAHNFPGNGQPQP